MWCVLAARHPCPPDCKHNPTRTKYYEQFQDEINESGISWPISPSQIHKFEKQNRYQTYNANNIQCLGFHICIVVTVVECMSQYATGSTII